MAPFHDHFNNKKIFITGHTGFKGAWLSIWLDALGAEVTGYSLAPPSEQSLFEATGLAGRITHIHGDIRNADSLAEAMGQAQPDIVFHLAAQSLVIDSYSDPINTLKTNVLGSAIVLEAVRKTQSVRTVVSVSTDKCYENHEQAWGYRENDPLGGHDPYSASKGAMEILCASWNRSFFLPEGRVAAATVRAGNVIGGGDFGANRLVPDYIRAVMAKRPLEIRMPQAIRPWQHVFEPLSGYMWLAVMLEEHPGDYHGAWNFAPFDNSCSVRDLVETIARVSATGSWQDCSDRNKGPHEAGILKLCSDKAASLLKWKAILDIEQTVDMTMRGYRPFIEDSLDGMHQLCLDQIDEYCALARKAGMAWAL
jgi:CDP-glucose 4,6-dehydratase